MQVNFDKSFIKDLKKLKNKDLAQKIKSQISLFENSENLNKLPNIKKLKGFDIYYRLKIGDYRLGFSISENQVTLIRFIHRKEIYRLFP